MIRRDTGPRTTRLVRFAIGWGTTRRNCSNGGGGGDKRAFLEASAAPAVEIGDNVGLRQRSSPPVPSVMANAIVVAAATAALDVDDETVAPKGARCW